MFTISSISGWLTGKKSSESTMAMPYQPMARLQKLGEKPVWGSAQLWACASSQACQKRPVAGS